MKLYKCGVVFFHLARCFKKIRSSCSMSQSFYVTVYFWLLRAAGRISVPQPEITHAPCGASVES